jgi:DNA-binding transcriptional regulator YiaG
MNDSKSIPEVEADLLDVYCRQITARFHGLDRHHRWKLLTDLRILLDTHLDSEDHIGNFDFKRARKIRVGLKLSRKELQNILQIHSQTLFKYETGKVIPNPANKTPARYLNWLQGNGFAKKSLDKPVS